RNFPRLHELQSPALSFSSPLRALQFTRSSDKSSIAILLKFILVKLEALAPWLRNEISRWRWRCCRLPSLPERTYEVWKMTQTLNTRGSFCLSLLAILITH